ncbi:MAG: hypothetical protein OEZ33_09705, partial [Gammaproteobacteria bacterium]|nr:hypothetical protein [Gammaproteobacteria bacterium]
MGVNQQPATKAQSDKQGNARESSLPEPKNSSSRVTALDRWLLRKMSDFVGNPPVTASLWDGVEYPPEGESVGHFKFN